MKQSGRISLLALASFFSVIVIVGLLLISKESPASVGTRFMAALDAHDVDTLSKLTMMKGASDENIRKQWDFTVNTAEKYYRFGYHIEGATQADANTASVKVRMIKDADHPGAYDELFELPMVKVSDQWKVDVRALSRDFYNCLPR